MKSRISTCTCSCPGSRSPPRQRPTHACLSACKLTMSAPRDHAPSATGPPQTLTAGAKPAGRCTGWPAWLVWAAQRFGHPQMHKPHSAQNSVESPQGAAGGPHGFHNVARARAAHLAYGPGCWRGAWGWLGAVTWLGGWLRSTSVTSRNPTRGAELRAEQVHRRPGTVRTAARATERMADADDEPVLDRSFRGHKGAVTSLAFNPTTRQLASGSADGEPRLRLSAIGGSCLLLCVLHHNLRRVLAPCTRTRPAPPITSSARPRGCPAPRPPALSLPDPSLPMRYPQRA